MRTPNACLLVICLLFGAAFARADVSPTISNAAKQLPLFETTEFSFGYEGWKGNPFDVMALATLTHVESNQKRITELFYVGGDRWKFRFTGDLSGQWRWKTASNHKALNGHSGALNVVSQPNPVIKGFLGHKGNRYVHKNHKGETEGALLFVYMNYVKFPTDQMRNKEPALVRFNDLTYFDAYMDDAWSQGFDTVFVSVGDPKLWMDSTDLDAKPNLATFSLLERMITRAHRRGMRIHFWQWKDSAKRATPKQFADGINGSVDQRLLRYIAARLGPLPGWTMGYGYDLHEWVSSQEVSAWADYLHAHMGWDHLLSSRGLQMSATENVINSYDGYGRNVALTTTYAGPRSYTEIKEDLEGDLTRPHLYEERHTYQRRNHDLDMEGTRRLLWWSVMAGGMGGFVGFYAEDMRAFAGYPYPKPDQLKLFGDFWRQHWHLGYQVCNDVSNGYGLCGKDRFLFYRTEAKKLKLELPSFVGKLPVSALNTVTGEWIDLGMKRHSFREFVAPNRSDWLLMIGEF